MIETYRKLLDLLTPRERRSFYVLLVMIVVMGIFQMLTVASILPLMFVLQHPAIVETSPTLSWIYASLGFTSHRGFMLALASGGLLPRDLRDGLQGGDVLRHLPLLDDAQLHDLEPDAERLPVPALHLVPRPAQRRPRGGGARRGAEGRVDGPAAGDEVHHRPGDLAGADRAAPHGAAGGGARRRRGDRRDLRPALCRRAPAHQPHGPGAPPSERAAVPHRRRGLRRDEGREAPRARGLLRRPLPGAGAAHRRGRRRRPEPARGAALRHRGRRLRRARRLHPLPADHRGRIVRQRDPDPLGLRLHRHPPLPRAAAGLRLARPDALRRRHPRQAAQGLRGHGRPHAGAAGAGGRALRRCT